MKIGQNGSLTGHQRVYEPIRDSGTRVLGANRTWGWKTTSKPGPTVAARKYLKQVALAASFYSTRMPMLSLFV